jgi:hypothetical protein
MKPTNDIIRNCYVISEHYAQSVSDKIVEFHLQETKNEAITTAKKLGWQKWELTEMFSPRYLQPFLEAPLEDKRDFSSWKKVLAWGEPCLYQVILYKIK